MFRRFDNPKELGLKPADVIRFYEQTKKIENDEKYDIFNTWNIKRSKESKFLANVESIDEDNIELSDIEIDNSSEEDDIFQE